LGKIWKQTEEYWKPTTVEIPMKNPATIEIAGNFYW